MRATVMYGAGDVRIENVPDNGGIGLAQRRGGPIEVIRPDDRVLFEPGEDHWHGAAPTRFMTHIAMLEVDDEGNPATWGDHVSDEEHAAAPAIDH